MHRALAPHLLTRPLDQAISWVQRWCGPAELEIVSYISRRGEQVSRQISIHEA